MAEPASDAPPAASLRSDHSTEQLICDTPRAPPDRSVSTSSAEAGSDKRHGSKRLVVFLGLAQVLLGALLVGAGALAVVKGAALARVGAGLWAGCVGVVGGVVGVLAGVNDCYGLSSASSSPMTTAFLALSLLCLACGNSAAVLAATGLQRDALRPPQPSPSFEDEMQAWTPVLTNISVLIIASLHCLVCVVSIYHLSRRVCPCLRPKQAFDHNQFDPTYKPCVFHVNEKKGQAEMVRGHELARDLETKLQIDTIKKKKEEPAEFGSANSKERLVTRWLGQAAPTSTTAAARPRRPPGVRKARKPPPVMLVPAHPASTLGRMPMSVGVMLGPRYATLPLPPYAPPMYYPMPDTRMRRRAPRSERSAREAGAREAGARERRGRRARGTQLTRSLERIHRRRRDPPTVDDLKRTYTGLDRAYAEQFIAVCDESRLATEHHDSLATTATTDSDDHPDPRDATANTPRDATRHADTLRVASIRR